MPILATKIKNTKYHFDGRFFMPAGDMVEFKELPPGMYNVLTGLGGPIASRCESLCDDLIIFPDSKSEEILREIEKFWTLEDKFKKYGFMHKRGFLLHGSPGSGKTSTVMLVTKHMVDKEDGIVFYVKEFSALVRFVSTMREIETNRKIVVILEDIDSMIALNDEREILSFLDGEMSSEHIVFIATTNYIQNLPPRFVNRPSRFDVVIKINPLSLESRKLFLTKRDPTLGDLEATEWAEKSEGFSIAHLKEMFVSIKCFGHGVDETIERLRNMSVKSDSDDDLGNMRKEFDCSGDESCRCENCS